MGDILLESGTNELELLQFRVGDQKFGINISKVTEIMTYQKVTPVPNSKPQIEGVFTPRGKTITVIDLHTVLNKEHPSSLERNLLIVCHFNQMDVGFHVGAVDGIKRISWEQIEKPPAISGNPEDAVITGLAKFNNEVVMVLDFEKIVSDLDVTNGLNTEGITDAPTDKTNKHIVLAEDSPFLQTLVVNTLKESGYTRVDAFANGKEAWEYINNVGGMIDLLISDIEMPQMDGHRLTKLIKDNKDFNHIPVYLFSSLINDQMREKGKAVGADAQFSKPQIGELVSYLNEHI